MNELKIFESLDFGSIRTMEIDGEPWFATIDVCRAVDIKNPSQAITRLDADEKMTTLILDERAASGTTQLSFINEPGLYSLVLGSRKKEAREFKRWITHEVIPSIRKTGGYSADKANPFSAMIPKDYPSALRALADKREENQRLEAKIALDAPKTRFADCVADSPELSYVSELAKVLKQNGVNIGRTRVFEWLREHEYIMKTGSKYNEPTQKAMNRKLFHVVKDRFGNAITKMTQKGFIVLLNEIMDDYTGQNQMAII